jgi:hypothetical protein
MAGSRHRAGTSQRSTAKYIAQHSKSHSTAAVFGYGISQQLIDSHVVSLMLQVMMVPKQQRRVMKGAMEMAVQESLSHPNIVR